MTWVIDTAYRNGEWYHVDGTDLAYGCSASGTRRRLDSTSKYGYVSALGRTGMVYVTENVLSIFRNSPEWSQLQPLILAVVKNDHIEKVACTFLDRYGYIWQLKADAIIGPIPPDDPCKDVSCPDMCVGVDKYNQACQDGICVRGTLIETNAEHCGYTPDPTPDDPDPTPEPSDPTVIYIAAGGALIIAYYILSR